jgi:hypothetical protein
MESHLFSKLIRLLNRKHNTQTLSSYDVIGLVLTQKHFRSYFRHIFSDDLFTLVTMTLNRARCMSCMTYRFIN